jgi:toxin ParE1/3/4
MILPIRKADQFIADFERQFRWYDRQAGWNVARRFLFSVDRTLERLAKQPDLGRVRHFPQPELLGLRSLSLERPFHRHLVFYRIAETVIEAWRLMHGAPDLPRRLLESFES